MAEFVPAATAVFGALSDTVFLYFDCTTTSPGT